MDGKLKLGGIEVKSGGSKIGHALAGLLGYGMVSNLHFESRNTMSAKKT